MLGEKCARTLPIIVEPTLGEGDFQALTISGFDDLHTTGLFQIEYLLGWCGGRWGRGPPAAEDQLHMVPCQWTILFVFLIQWAS